jgi:septal ring factor EnvC (AmiA/AmiB activator)
MFTKRTFVSLAVVSLTCAALLLLSPTQGRDRDKDYEVNTHYELPEYRTDAARAIDAQEKLMNRMLDGYEHNNEVIQQQLDTINTKLDKILSNLDNISQRIAKIETKMGIEDTPEEDNPKPGELQQQQTTPEKI